jgi:hypothetical protein
VNDTASDLRRGGSLLEYRSAPTTSAPTAKPPVMGWGLVMLPPVVAVLSWPVAFAIFFVLGFSIALMAMTACLGWAWHVSERVAAWRYWTRVFDAIHGTGIEPSPGYRYRLKALLFALQAVAILLSCPLFGVMLHVARRLGLRVGVW